MTQSKPERRGNVIATPEHFALLPANVATINNWRGDKTQKKRVITYKALDAANLDLRTVLDSQVDKNGEFVWNWKYVLFVFSSHDGLMDCWKVMDKSIAEKKEKYTCAD